MKSGKIYLTLVLAAGAFLSGFLVLDACSLSDLLKVTVYGPLFLLFLALMFKPSWLVAGVGVVVCVSMFLHLGAVRNQEAAAFRPIATAARQVMSSNPVAGNVGTLSGKALIWDAAYNGVSPAQYRLPFPLRAQPGDQAMTVFIVSGIRSQLVTRYHKKRPWYDRGPDGSGLYPEVLGAGYRDTADVAVISWPDRRMLGWHAVAGDAPPKTVQLQAGQKLDPQHGNLIGPIAGWIRSMPFVSDPRNKTDASAGFLPQFNPDSTQQRTWTVAEAQAEAVRRYPQLAIANSRMNRAFVERYNKEKASNSALLRDPAWPLRIAEDVAP
jgi:hypothetical protein